MDKSTLSHLRTGSFLKGSAYTYHIEKVLGQGSFGITYLATTRISVPGPLGNIETEIKVAVKEFFMKEFSSRHEDGTITEMAGGSLVSNYAKKFRREAENLAKLQHPNIVNVLEVFDANNTCYYSMQYMEGGSLDEYVRIKGGLPENEAKECIRQIGEAVSYMHDHKMLHLDLKPSNVMRSGDGSRMVLIDFGLSKQYAENGIPESSTTIGLGTPGYAPIEQSSADRDRDFAPTLDVYALGATYFKLLTGQTPPKASDVNDEGLPTDVLRQKGVSRTGITVIEMAMEPRKSRRMKSVSEFLSLLDGSEDDEKTDIKTPQPPVPEPPVPPAPKPKRKLWIALAAAAVAAVLCLLLIPKFISDGDDVPVVIDDANTVAVAEKVPDKKTESPAPAKTQPSNSSPEPAAPAVVELKSITLNRSSLELEAGETASLTVKYTPSDATDMATTWKSTDTKVVTVSAKGKVTAVKAGSASIIAKCGDQDAYCNITVKAKPESEPVKTQPSEPVRSSARPTTGSINGHEYVDLGLPSGLLWATRNVGASSPSDYGGYYAWGETSTKGSYSWSNLKYCNDNTGDSFSKYNKDQAGTKDNKMKLDLSDDAARANWGGSWRMPTKAEWVELMNSCTWTWTSQGGHNGYKVTGKNGNSIFLPAAGWRNGDSLDRAGERGYYWSSSLNTGGSYYAYNCYFNSSYVYPSDWYNRFSGQSVRPVSSSIQ